MKIGIIGSGNIGGGLGRLWSQAGHELMFSARQAAGAEQLVREIGAGAQTGTVAATAAFGDVVCLALPFDNLDEALAEVGSLAGKVVLDATNPYHVVDGQLVIALPEGGNAAQQLAAKLPQARVVKAFNTLPAEQLKNAPQGPPDTRPTMFYCSDDAAAKVVVNGLISDAGFASVDTGPLAHAAWQEPRGRLYGKVLPLAQAQQLLAAEQAAASTGPSQPVA